MIGELQAQRRIHVTRITLMRWLLWHCVEALRDWRTTMGMMQERMGTFQDALRGARRIAIMNTALKYWAFGPHLSLIHI